MTKEIKKNSKTCKSQAMLTRLHMLWLCLDLLQRHWLFCTFGGFSCELRSSSQKWHRNDMATTGKGAFWSFWPPLMVEECSNILNWSLFGFESASFYRQALACQRQVGKISACIQVCMSLGRAEWGSGRGLTLGLVDFVLYRPMLSNEQSPTSRKKCAIFS